MTDEDFEEILFEGKRQFFLKDEDVENIKQRSEQLQIESNNPIDSVYKHILDAFVLLRYARCESSMKTSNLINNYETNEDIEVLIKNLKNNDSRMKDLSYHCLMLYRDIKEIKLSQDLFVLAEKMLGLLNKQESRQ